MITIKKSTLYRTECQVEEVYLKEDFLMSFLCKMSFTNVLTLAECLAAQRRHENSEHTNDQNHP